MVHSLILENPKWINNLLLENSSFCHSELLMWIRYEIFLETIFFSQNRLGTNKGYEGKCASKCMFAPCQDFVEISDDKWRKRSRSGIVNIQFRVLLRRTKIHGCYLHSGWSVSMSAYQWILERSTHATWDSLAAYSYGGLQDSSPARTHGWLHGDDYSRFSMLLGLRSPQSQRQLPVPKVPEAWSPPRCPGFARSTATETNSSARIVGVGIDRRILRSSGKFLK